LNSHLLSCHQGTCPCISIFKNIYVLLFVQACLFMFNHRFENICIIYGRWYGSQLSLVNVMQVMKYKMFSCLIRHMCIVSVDFYHILLSNIYNRIEFKFFNSLFLLMTPHKALVSNDNLAKHIVGLSLRIKKRNM